MNHIPLFYDIRLHIAQSKVLADANKLVGMTKIEKGRKSRKKTVDKFKIP